ncbi:hypothetical protein MBH78_20370 [Oceanimonas sp. NS1]|nr:hypothetical protein [Oceanimonas sp. NS1]
MDASLPCKIMLKLFTKLALLLLACVRRGTGAADHAVGAGTHPRRSPPHTQQLVAEARYAEAADYLGFLWNTTM